MLKQKCIQLKLEEQTPPLIRIDPKCFPFLPRYILSEMMMLITMIITSCRRAAAMICPRPGLQWKRAAAALSQAGQAGPDQPTRAIHPAGRTRHTPPANRMYATDVRQHHRLMPLGGGIIVIIIIIISTCCSYLLSRSAMTVYQHAPFRLSVFAHDNYIKD